MQYEIKEVTIEDAPRVKLEKYLAARPVKIAMTFDELLGPNGGQTPEEITAEVNDFLQLREEWHKELDRENFDL